MENAPRAALLATFDAIPLALAAAAVAAAIFPGPAAALPALALGSSAIILDALLAVRGRGRATRLAAFLGGVAVLAAVTESAPRSAPFERLVAAVARIERNWSALIERADGALGAVPAGTASQTAEVLDARRETLGPDVGLALLDAKLERIEAWTGWTTLLAPDESAELLGRLKTAPAVLPLRRGLALRLAVARRDIASGRVLVAEVPLEAEPSLDALGAGLGPGVEANVRWQAWGEGVRAAVTPTRSPTETAPYWSLVPLMTPGGDVAARVSLGVLPAPAERARLAERRAALAARFAALVLSLFALAAVRGGVWAILAARLLVAAVPESLPSPLISGSADWLGQDTRGALGVLASLFDTPAAAALTGLAAISIAALAPLPVGRTVRRSLGTASLVLLLAGVAIAGWCTATAQLSLLEIVGGAPGAGQRALLALALASPAWTAATIAARCLAGPGPVVRYALAAFAAGSLAALGHGVTVGRAQALAVERGVVPAIRDRQETWNVALVGSLALTRPDPDPASLSPERDAIDLWWNGPLGRLGLASGAWKYGADGTLEDAFVTGIPPVDPSPQLASLDAEAGGADRPVPVTFDFVGGSFPLRLAQRERPLGGRWIVAVLDEPGNLPGLATGDPLRGRRAPPPPAALFPPAPDLEPRLAWFDSRGVVVHSDVEPAPAPPLAMTGTWRAASVQSRPARILDLPDRGGTISVILFPPRPFALAATAIGWGVFLSLLTLAAFGARRLLASPLDSGRAIASGARLVIGRFQVQVAVLLLAAGLVPLLALGSSLRALATRQAAQQLTTEGARAVGYARGFLEDYLALEGERGMRLDDALAAWLARTLGDDVEAWEEDGALSASSRPDLVRAGLVPDRLDGHTWREIVSDRAALVEERLPGETAGRARGAAIAHGPLLAPGGGMGVVGVTLGRAGQRVAEELRDVDRGLLVSSALLVLLASAVVAPAARRLVRPLAELERATARVAGGEFDAPLPETGYDETRSLSRAFRAMAGSLAAQREGLERRREAMERLIASMPLAVLALREDGSVWATNPAARALLAERPDLPMPAAGTPPVMVNLPGTTDTRHLRVSSIRLPRELDDEPERLVIVEDLSDTVRSERLVAWAEMARRIAHEIKNPLTPISLVVEHVRRLAASDDPRLPAVLDRALATISDQVLVLRETAREFSDYARLFSARPERLDLAPLLDQWLAAYRLAPPADVQFEADGPATLPPVLADPRLLRRALVNLVENALVAVEEGGLVRVTWGLTGGTPRGVAISVADTGPGIDPERLAQLFEPDVTTRETGSGLGLPIARQAVDAQGGRIEVDSVPGRGTRFSIVLPMAEPEPPVR